MLDLDCDLRSCCIESLEYGHGMLDFLVLKLILYCHLQIPSSSGIVGVSPSPHDYGYKALSRWVIVGLRLQW